MSTIKRYRLNYRMTHKKIKKAIINMIKENDTLTVRNVAKRAGVSVSTAYNHNCQEMILEMLGEE